MSFINSLGKKLVSGGETLLMKDYVKQYGKQIGKVSRNGQRAFSRFEGNKEIITGLDREGNVISKITRDISGVHNNVGEGTIHTERFRDGILISTTDARLATNYRDILTHYSDGSVLRKTLYGSDGGWKLDTTVIPSVYAKNGVPKIVTTTKTFNA